MRLDVRETLAKTMMCVSIASIAGAFNGATRVAPSGATVGANVGEAVTLEAAPRPHADPALPRSTMGA